MIQAQEKDKEQWNTFVQQNKGSFLQSWEWGELQKKLSIPFWRIVIDHQGTWQAVALVIKRAMPGGKCWLYIPKGPLCVQGEGIWPELEKEIKELAQREKAIFIRIDPEWTTPPEFLKTWRPAERQVQPQHTLVVNLSASEEELLASMHHKTRYNIRLAEKKGVNIRFSSDRKDLQSFLDLTHDVSERSVFKYHPEAYYQALVEILSKNQHLEIALAEYQGEVLAVHLIIIFNKIATYAHGASSSKARSVMAPHLLQWATIKRAKEKGLQLYDFYGVASPAAKAMGDKHSWAGITRFKEGFGGQRKSYIGAYDYVLNKTWYWGYNLMHRIRR